MSRTVKHKCRYFEGSDGGGLYYHCDCGSCTGCGVWYRDRYRNLQATRFQLQLKLKRMLRELDVLEAGHDCGFCGAQGLLAACKRVDDTYTWEVWCPECSQTSIVGD